MNIIAVAGWTILSIAGVGTIASVILEVHSGEPKYYAWMKIFSFMIATGGVLVGLGSM